MRKQLFLFISAFILSVFAVSGQGFIHPGALHTQADFDRIKAQLAANEPNVVAAYARLTSNSYSSSSYTPRPVTTIIRGGTGENYVLAYRDAAAAYQNALRWKISGDVAHAEAAINILNAWARTCTGIGGDTNYALAAGLYGYEFANAGELMRDYEGWTPEDFKKYQEWMAYVFFPSNVYFLKNRNGTLAEGYPAHYWSNWGLCNVLSVMSIGILCDDPFIYNWGVSYYKYNLTGTFKDYVDPSSSTEIICRGFTEYIGNLVVDRFTNDEIPYGYWGQMQESGRDQGHALMALGLAIDVAQTGWNQGDDLFAFMNNRLAAGIEYQAAHAAYQWGNTEGVAPENLPWVKYIRMYYPAKTDIHYGIALGYGGDRPYWERIIGHYEGVKGVDMHYAEMVRDIVGVDGGGGNYGTTSGGFDHLGYSTLTCTRPKVAPDQAPVSLGGHIVRNGVLWERSELTGVVIDDSIRLVPELPDTVTDNGNWEWSTGATTSEFAFKADTSGVYRVTYTGDNGVKSTEIFSIAVYGDCFPNRLTPKITVDGVVHYDTVITILPYTPFTLSASPAIGYGSYSWSTGATSSSITIDDISEETTYSLEYKNMGGYVSYVNYHIKLSILQAALTVDDGESQKVKEVVIDPGQTVELTPLVASDKNTGTWSWSTGSTAQNLRLENMQNSVFYTVTYTYEGEEYVIDYKVYVALTDMQIAEGDYFIKDAATGLYYTNDGSLQPVFGERSEEEPLSQSWKFTKDAESGRYKIVSNLDGRFMEEHGRFNDHDYYPAWNTYTLHGLSETDLYAIQNGGSSGTDYWIISGDIISVGTSSLDGYPFEIVPFRYTGTTDVELPVKVEVYPNPVSDFLAVNIAETNTGNGTFTLYAINGSALKSISCYAGTNHIETMSLPKGLYIGVLNLNGKEERFKIVKQ